MNYRGYGMVFVAMLLAACEMGGSAGAAAPEAQPSSAASTPVAQVAASAEDIESRLSKNMAYADLRNLAMAAGWKSVLNPECKKNVGGEARICEQLPELESCSGDGYCVMKFRNESLGQFLNVTTYGMREDWNVSGSDSRLNMIEWEFVQ